MDVIPTGIIPHLAGPMIRGFMPFKMHPISQLHFRIWGSETMTFAGFFFVLGILMIPFLLFCFVAYLMGAL